MPTEAEAIAAWNKRPADAVLEQARKVAEFGRDRPVAFLSTDIPELHQIAQALAALLKEPQ